MPCSHSTVCHIFVYSCRCVFQGIMCTVHWWSPNTDGISTFLCCENPNVWYINHINCVLKNAGLWCNRIVTFYLRCVLHIYTVNICLLCGKHEVSCERIGSVGLSREHCPLLGRSEECEAHSFPFIDLCLSFVWAWQYLVAVWCEHFDVMCKKKRNMTSLAV